MREVDHDDISILTQYLMLLNCELDKFRQEHPEYTGRKKIARCVEKIVDISKRMVDKKITGGAKVSDPISKDSVFWAQIVTMIILLGIGISMGIGYMAVADLENCVYKGMCVETPKGGN